MKHVCGVFRAGKAPVLPGAKGFIEAVRALQGRVALITNRTQDQCAATAENLRRQGIAFERILCDAVGDGKKNARFNAIIAGSDGTPPMNVLAWVGDNIQDFPSLTQAAPGDFALPNPWYGSWQDVEPR